MSTVSAYALRLLGPPRLETPQGGFAPDRRTAAILAYLALEGPTPKYKLAGWLWPDSGETTARNNMRQLLRRLRLAGAEVVTGEETLELAPGVEIDLNKLSYLEAPTLELLAQNQELLEGLSYDDAPDFEEWLTSAKEELRELRARAAKGEAERLERAGNLKAALAYAQVWVRLEPLSEEANRQAMRLHYLLGDRGAALGVFERLKTLLAQELGAGPLPQTLELARMVERGAELPGEKPRPMTNTLPTAILRPPVLVGREREWAAMEEAWAAGKLIFVVGEPGAGKSRLAGDFLSSKSRYIHLETRPGDANIPYSFNNRMVRTALRQYQDYQVPEWVRQTLAPWLPELGEASLELDPALQIRYFDAIGHVFNQIGAHGEAVFIDDLQFMDDSSARTGEYLLSSLFPLNQPGGLKGFVCCYRKGELSPAIEQIHAEMTAQGIGVRIFLEPLPADSVEAMLGGMGIENPEHLVPGLSRYTGGNPMFVLETLKHLIETDTLDQGLPARLIPQGKVAALIARRLGRLSPAALNLARMAAVAGTEFNLELAHAVLERPPMELAEAHAELEAAQILRGNAFVHDLIYEAVLANLPVAVGQLLHARTARWLEDQRNPNPTLIARYWLGSGEGGKAAGWLLRAGNEARALGLFDDAVGLYTQVLELAPDPETRLQAQAGLTYPLVALGRLGEAESLARGVIAEAPDPRTRIQALDALQTALMWRSRHAEAEAAIREAQRLAEGLGDEALADEMRFSHGFILARLGRDAEAAAILEPLLPRYRTRPMGFERLHLLSVLGGVYGDLGRFAEAKALLHEALSGAKQIGSHTNQILAANDLQYTHNLEGTPEGGLPHTLEALALGEYVVSESLRAKLAHAYLLLGRSAEAADQLEWLIARAQDPNTVGSAWARLARARARLGRDHRKALAEAMNRYEQIEVPAARLEIVGAVLEHGDAAQRAWARKMLGGLEADALSPPQRAEYERLRGSEA